MHVVATTVTFTVTDPLASASFFVQHFGYQQVLSFEGGSAIERPDGGPTLFFMQFGSSVLEQSLRYSSAQGVSLALTVQDLDLEVSRLTANGVRLRSEIEQDDWGERHAQVLDPNGLIIQLVQWISGRPY